MYKFYKIEDGKAQVGQGTFVPDGFIVYEDEPQELIDALALEKKEQDLNTQIQEAKKELASLDWINSKYVREVQVLKSMTADEYYKKYELEYIKMKDLVIIINNLELQLV